MKTLKSILAAVVLAAGLSSCVGDLTVTVPLDPNLNTANNALQTESDYEAFLAAIYTGFATSGYYGENGGPSLEGLDGGFSQYVRGRLNLNELTTDVMDCLWDDEGVPDMHNLNWSTSNALISSFYYRICHQIGLCNAFIREVNNATIDLPKKAQWIAEARALRTYCWLDGIDNFGKMPFADETFVIGSEGPDMKSRADIFAYTEGECKDLLAGNDLPGYGQAVYGHADKGLVAMVLAKLYLNAEVYVGEPMFDKCADVLKGLASSYSLHTESRGGKFSAFQELFLADNDLCTDEIIFAIQQDMTNTRSWGATTFIIYACTGGKMDAASLGISSGWGGLRATKEAYQKFSTDDDRYLFHTETQVTTDLTDRKDFTYGAAYQKFMNVTSAGASRGTADKHVDTDFPVFRYADALLMLAECELNGVSCGGLDAFNDVRERAGVAPVAALTEDLLLDERLRELALEGWRRSDLIRFGKFTSDSYLWEWKGGVYEGKGVEAHRVLFPIPSADLNANNKLTQNDGYGK